MSIDSTQKMDLDGFLEWARDLGMAAVRDRVFVALDGPLGAGKTTLVRAACEGAGLKGPVTSPTFTLIHRYGVDAESVYHVDLYRIEDPRELDELGWEDLTAGEHAVFAEWAKNAVDRLPVDRWHVRLDITDGGRTRSVEIDRHGRVPELPVPR